MALAAVSPARLAGRARQGSVVLAAAACRVGTKKLLAA